MILVIVCSQEELDQSPVSDSLHGAQLCVRRCPNIFAVMFRFTSVRGAGGWAEACFHLSPDKLHTHVGGGIDNPDASDVALGQLIRNETIFANLIQDVTTYFRVGGEVTYRDTVYKGLPGNDGVGFQTQVQWKF